MGLNLHELQKRGNYIRGYIFKPGVPQPHARFLEITFIRICMSMFMHMRPSPRPKITRITSGMIWNSYDWLNNSCCFPVLIYGLAVNIVHGCGPSNEIRQQLQPLLLQQKVSYALYITNKMEHDPCRQYNLIQKHPECKKRSSQELKKGQDEKELKSKWAAKAGVVLVLMRIKF